MAKKKKSSSKVENNAPPPSAVPDEAEGDESAEEDGVDDDVLEEECLLQVDVGDVVKLKQVLDETVAHAILDVLELPEDLVWDNIKLGIMATACLFAMVAQFYPAPFPESRFLLGICCCLYFVLSGILQLLITFYDQDCICMTKPIPKKKDKSNLQCPKNPACHEVGLRIRTFSPRFSEFYTVILELQKGKEEASGSEVKKQVSQQWSVGQFFDVEGFFDEVGLIHEIEALWERMKNGDYDKPEEASSTAAATSSTKKNN